MKVRRTQLDDVFIFSPDLLSDARGTFLESYKSSVLRGVSGRRLDLAQVNMSVSHLGVIRGIHVTRNPPGQAKYVQCVNGRVLDIAVDLRPGSRTLGEHTSVILDDQRRESIFIGEGFGHAFCALSESAVVLYLTSTIYDPESDLSVYPLDPRLNLPWPTNLELRLSQKDRDAPTLEEFLSALGRFSG